ncbi:MAG: hypothetical protein KDA51_11730, partial [Planctomycetales bacterium]|nr:hypothetical protein [Planctomycetales bacterium]
AGGSYELSELLHARDAIASHPLLAPSLMLILIGAFTKSAQFPFHFWLPNAMQAPTPVSAYLHSATMVKAGVYLVARLRPAVSGLAIWDNSLLTIGVLTAIFSGWLALQQTDLKRILAYSTVSTLGLLMLLLGIGTALATKAAIVLLLFHALYKATLFLVSGTVDHCAGTRDLRQLGGLSRVMPLVALTAALAALSMAGLPPSGGFLAKELSYEAMLDPTFALIMAAVFLANASFVAVACLVVVRPFFGKSNGETRHTHTATFGLVAPPFLLALLGMLAGLFVPAFGKYLLESAVLAVQPGAGVMKWRLWHGFNLPLLLSVLTLASGIGLYAINQRILAVGRALPNWSAWGPD